MAIVRLPITQTELHRILDYDAGTGIFRWKENPAQRPQWNGRYAGKIAGHVNGFGYRVLYIYAACFFEHHLAWFYIHGEWAPDQVDHKNGRRDDNRIENLRPATIAQNRCNRPVFHRKTSPYRGVYFHKTSGLWRAEIRSAGRARSLGYYKTPEEARDAFQKGAEKLHGEFARFD